MDTKIKNIDIHSSGSYTIRTENGVLGSTPTNYTFSNDLSQGNFNNSTERSSVLQSSQNVKINHNLTVGGSSQMNVGGMWTDVGSTTLQNGHPQIMASRTNDELFALLSQYSDRDDGEPIFNPLPNLEQNLIEAGNMTAAMNPISLPSITKPTDIPLWIAAWTSSLIQQNTVNQQARLVIAAKMTEEDLQEQIKMEEENLKDKYGEELYTLLFKSKVEAGYIYNKPEKTYTITKKDVYDAAISDGKVEKRNAFLSKMG